VSFKRVPIEKIRVPEVRASSKLTPEQQAFFEGTVEKYGVLQPILIRPIGGGRYELIAGKTRLEELKKQGVRTVEAKVVQASSKDAYLMHIAENYARGTTDPINTAKVIKKALDEGAGVEEVAKIFNHKPEWVRFMVGLLKLPEVYQRGLKEGRLNVTHIREAFKLPDLKEVDHALASALRLNWSASVLARYVQNRLAEYEVAERKSLETGVKYVPPAPEPERLVKYDQCYLCNRMVERERISLPPACDDCYQLAKYVISQVGTGEEAMQHIFRALDLQQQMEQRQREILIQQQLAAQPVQAPTPPQQILPESVRPERSQPIEDEDLRSLIKRMIKEELKSRSS